MNLSLDVFLSVGALPSKDGPLTVHVYKLPTVMKMLGMVTYKHTW